MSLVRSLAAIVFVGVSYTLLMFGVVRLRPSYEAVVIVAVVLIGFVVVAYGVTPARESKNPGQRR